MTHNTRPFLGTLLVLTLYTGAAHAAPAVPSGPHPRLFLDGTTLAAFQTNAAKNGSAASKLIAACQDTLDHPEYNTMRNGADGDVWPGGALRCAFAYLATSKAEYLTQSLMFWHAALDADQTIDDKAGCVVGVDTDWKNHWDGNYPPPPVLLTVSHDTGYPMRWYGPFLSLTYDWLYNAPGVDDVLRAQTRTCLTAWMDWYTDRGYLRDVAGMNYQAGFTIAKTLAGIAIGTDGGADGHLWNETVDDLFGRILIGNGTTWTPDSSSTPVLPGLFGNHETVLGKPVGNMVGGDWGSWEYGPLSVAEYAAATLALEKNGAPLPAMDEWLNSIAVRYMYGSVPQADAQYCGCGDCGDGSSDVNAGPSANTLDAVLLGPSSDQAASWALFMKQKQGLNADMIWNALGETRGVQPADYSAQPSVPLWYIARGTRSMYVRSSWQPDALWSVFESPPAILDHQHYSAGSFVFTRGADNLIVDPAPYGGVATFESNAVTVDSAVLPGDYAQSQSSWSSAELIWARGTDDAVYAARSDFAHAFDFNGTPSDVPYAHREWVLLPEGEVVTIDRVHTAAASNNMYVGFHTNTGAAGLTLAADGTATGSVGASKVAIHPVFLSGGAPTIVQPPVGDCFTGCSYPCGSCEAVRLPVDKYTVAVPGTWAVAVHVIDALAAGDALASVGSLNDDTVDPAPKQNGDVLGAAVYRGQKQTYVVASSAVDGAAPATMKYAVRGDSSGRHVVFDAPEAADGSSSVTAAADSAGRCVVQISAGSGQGLAGHPLLFVVAEAAQGCAVTESTSVDPGTPPPGGGAGPGGSSAGGASAGGSSGTSASPTGAQAKSGNGCSCELTRKPFSGEELLWAAGAAALLVSRRRKR